MIKYIMRNIELPSELITHIYSFIDDKTKIKKLPEIWFKRIISADYQYYSSKMKRMCLAVEERMLNMLIKQGAFNVIHNMHRYNIENRIRYTEVVSENNNNNNI